jgi:hypothetical protein
LARRIVEREPAGLPGLDAFIAHGPELAERMPALAGVDLVLSTHGQHARDVAARIRAARPARLGAAVAVARHREA